MLSNSTPPDAMVNSLPLWRFSAPSGHLAQYELVINKNTIFEYEIHSQVKNRVFKSIEL